MSRFLAAMERHGIGLDGETLQHLADDFPGGWKI